VLSIANRLAMLFGAITLGVIGVVYIYVVPPLESSLPRGKSNSGWLLSTTTYWLGSSPK